jgi:hypothetical protein
VHIEVLTLAAAAAGRLAYRRDVDHLQGSETPDEAAVRISEVPADGAYLVHSTSWRHTSDAVVLTYAVAPDPHDGRDGVELSTASGSLQPSDPTRPGAGPIRTEDVVAHACRHLALLADVDPAVSLVAAKHPDLWRTIRAHGLGLAGQLPAALHPIG